MEREEAAQQAKEEKEEQLKLLFEEARRELSQIRPHEESAADRLGRYIAKTKRKGLIKAEPRRWWIEESSYEHDLEGVELAKAINELRADIFVYKIAQCSNLGELGDLGGKYAERRALDPKRKTKEIPLASWEMDSRSKILPPLEATHDHLMISYRICQNFNEKRLQLTMAKKHAEAKKVTGFQAAREALRDCMQNPRFLKTLLEKFVAAGLVSAEDDSVWIARATLRGGENSHALSVELNEAIQKAFEHQIRHPRNIRDLFELQQSYIQEGLVAPVDDDDYYYGDEEEGGVFCAPIRGNPLSQAIFNAIRNHSRELLRMQERSRALETELFPEEISPETERAFLREIRGCNSSDALRRMESRYIKEGLVKAAPDDDEDERWEDLSCRPLPNNPISRKICDTLEERYRMLLGK